MKRLALFFALFFTLGATLLAVPPGASAAVGCAGHPGCVVLKLTGIIQGHDAGATMLGTKNSPTQGQQLELRSFSTTRTPGQFLMASNGQIVAGGTNLCVAGFSSRAVLVECGAPLVPPSQKWTFAGGKLTDAAGNNLYVTSVVSLTPVTTSTVHYATWVSSPV